MVTSLWRKGPFCGVLQQLSFRATVISLFINPFKPRNGEATPPPPLLALGFCTLLHRSPYTYLHPYKWPPSYIPSENLLFPLSTLTDSLSLFKVVHIFIDHEAAK